MVALEGSGREPGLQMYHPLLFVALVSIALTGGSRVTMAADAPDGAARISAERDHARTELDRLNAEIDALKQRRRGLGDDYQLRQKMADAEAVARRLTQLESRLAPTATPARASTGAGPTRSLPPAPRPNATDDRDVREAKADILADQARRLNQQVSVLERRVDELRVRQELRRRAGELERDPFSPLEQAKRRLPLGIATPAAEKGPTPERAGGAGSATIPPPAGGSASFAGGTDSSKGTAVATAAPSAQSGPGAASPSAVPVPIAPTAGPESTSSLATQFRGILDPSTLAEIRKLEGSGNPTSRLPAAERALAALRARAQQLQSSADTMRAAPPPHD
jgi:hypothetical protein